MPKIGTKPSFNHKVIKGMSKEDLIEMHPDADVEHVVKEWEKAGGRSESKPAKQQKEVKE